MEHGSQGHEADRRERAHPGQPRRLLADGHQSGALHRGRHRRLPHGRFTSQRAPAQPGYAGSATGIVAVPGTGSFWATGMLPPLKTGDFKTDILRYVPSRVGSWTISGSVSAVRKAR